MQTTLNKAVSTRRKRIRHIAFVIMMVLFGSFSANADTIPPNKLLDLSPFTLTLPINSSGTEQMGTKALSIKNAQLAGGYFSKYFYGAQDSGVVFWCPIDGATTTPTAGSNHPRTELSESYLWTPGKGGTLSATLIANQYPKDSNNIIIGQIHGGGIYNTAPFVLLQLKSGSLIATVKGTLTDNLNTKKSTLLTNVLLGTKISYTITADTSTIYFTASCKGATGTGSWSTAIPAPWIGLTVHFSAGDYVQSTGTDSTDGGKVTFYKLNILHSAPLPISIESFEANAVDNKEIILNWKMASEKENTSISIEKSRDGNVFSSVKNIEFSNYSGTRGQYFYKDINPFSGMNYYRLAWQNIYGEKQYSKVVRVSFKKEEGITFSQNAFNNTAVLHYNGTLGVAFLYNSVGKICAKYTISKGQNIIYLNKIIGSSGIYYLQIEDKTFKLLKP